MLPLLPLPYGGHPPLRVVNLPALDIWPCHITFVESTAQPGWFQTFHITFVVQLFPQRKLRYNYGIDGGVWTQHDGGAVALVPNESVFRYHADQIAAIVLAACREFLRALTLAINKINTLQPPKPSSGSGSSGSSGFGSSGLKVGDAKG